MNCSSAKFVRIVWLACVVGVIAACRGEQAPAPSVEASALSPEQAEGRVLYTRMCTVCHGASGEGYRADNAAALANPEFLASVTDAFLRAAIAQGRAGTPMSAWSVERGGPLAAKDINAVIAFLRSWYTGPRAALNQGPLVGDAQHGGAVFTAECLRCHGARGVTGPNIRIGDRALLAAASNGFLRHAIAKGRPGTAMLAFEKLLDPESIDDVIAYLRSLNNPTAPPPPMAPPAAAPPIPLGPVPLNPKGPEPQGFKTHPETTAADVVAAQLKRRARMVILDARAPSDYTSEHIAGAVSVPFYDPTPYVSQLPRDAWLVCYCACPHAESGELATKLIAAGFTKVTVLNEGLGTWKQKGYGVSTGVAP
jgi:cytochrome c oxidase cbb3-type subunit 3/ubiquinol-cytochrome c reductase cytochrome c subunit